MDYTQNFISDGIDKQIGVVNTEPVPRHDIPVPSFRESTPVQNEDISTPVARNVQGELKNLFSRPDPNAINQIREFDWNNADRFVDSKNYRLYGYNPYESSVKVGDKSYDPNELRYGAVQTFGDVMSNAAGGFWALTKNTFAEGWKGDVRLANALFGGIGSDQTFKERLIGTEDELMTMDEKQKAIFNKYAIYHTPESDNSTFNRQFLGDIIQQAGFSIGTTAQFLTEAALTWGIGEAISGFAKGSRAAALASKEGITLAEDAAKTIPVAERVNNARQAADITANTPFVNQVLGGAKQTLNWAGKQLNPLTGINDIIKVSEAGGTAWQIAGTSVGAAKRLFSQTNMAATEARFEAAGTFGQTYADLVSQYENIHNGLAPSGDELERIKETAYGAGTDNFIVNTGLLMTMNQIQFGNMFSRFGSSGKLLRNALEAGEKETFTIAAKALDGAAAKIYKNGRLGVFGQFRNIKKDFGLGTALWQVAKRSGTGTAAKFEITEGLQEILQSTSDNTFRDYYTNVYDGTKTLDGDSIIGRAIDADWRKGFATQMNHEGWKTFLMGAVTGMLISPLQAGVMYATRKGYSSANSDYKKQLGERDKVLEDAMKTQNSFYQNIGKSLNPVIGNIKVQGQAAKNMEEALAVGDRYMYHNGRTDALTSAVAAAIKTDNYDSLLSTIREYAQNLTDDELKNAFPALAPTDINKTNLRNYIEGIASDIEAYHDNRERLMEEFSHLIMPELYKNDPKQYSRMLQKKRVLNEAIEILATTSYKATDAVKRAAAIKTEISQLPYIGGSASKSFDILGNEQATDIEIQRLKEAIRVYDALGTADREINELEKNQREQLRHLEDWKEAYSHEGDRDIERLTGAQKGYILALNNEVSTGPKFFISRNDLEKSFEGLGHYIALNRDSSQYIEALNILTDPKNFQTFTERISEGLQAAILNNYIKQAQETKDKVDIATGTATETPDSTIPPAPADISTDQNIIDHIIDSVDLTAEATEQLLSFSQDIQDQLSAITEAIRSQVITPEVGRTEARRLLDHIRDEQVESLEYPNIENNPHVGRIGDRYRILFDTKHGVRAAARKWQDEISAKEFPTKVAANTALSEWIEGHYPGTTIPSPEEAEIYRERDKALNDFRVNSPSDISAHDYRKGLNDIEKDTDRKILSMQNPDMSSLDIEKKILDLHAKRLKGSVIKEGDRYVIKRMEESVSPFTTEKEAKELIDLYISNQKKQLDLDNTPAPDRNFEEEQVLTDDIGFSNMRLNYEDIMSVFRRNPGESTIEGAQAVTDLLTGMSTMELQENIFIDVVPNPLYKGGTFNPTQNPDIRVRQMPLMYLVRFGDDPIPVFTLQPHGANYEFQLSPGRWITTDSPEFMDDSIFGTNEFSRFFNLPKNLSSGVSLARFKSDIQKAQSLIRELVQGSYTPSQLQDKIQFTVTTTPNYVNENPKKGPVKTPSLFSEIEQGGLIFQDIIIDNGARGQENRYVAGIGNSELESELGSPDPNRPAGMYTAGFYVPDGTFRWVELSPARMSEDDVNDRIGRIKLLTAGESISQTEQNEANTILDTIFIATNPYRTGGDYLSQKVRFTNRISVDKNGETRMTLFLGQTTGLPSEREDAVLSLGRFSSIRDVQDLTVAINKAISTYDESKDNAPIVRSIAPISVDSFRHQVTDDMDSIRAMESSVHVNKDATGAVIPNSAITTGVWWDFQAEPVIEQQAAIPVVKVITPISVQPDSASIQVRMRELEQKMNDTRITDEEQDLLIAEYEGLASQLPPTSQSDLIEDSPSDIPEVPVPDELTGDPFREKTWEELEAEEAAEQERLKKSAKKIIPTDTPFNQGSVENIDRFTDWCLKNLPKNILSVRDLGTLSQNLREGNVTVGQFLSYLEGVNVKGRIDVFSDTPFKYHEAFHGIFRMLLSQGQIERLLKNAEKEYPVTEKKLKEFRVKGYNYKGQEERERLLEEYIADRFDSWKMDRSTRVSSGLKGLFNRIADLFREIWAKLTGSQMLGLFYEIDRGAYRNAKLQDNQFTGKDYISATQPVAKVIEIGLQRLPDGTTVKKYLPQMVANQLSATIAGQVISELRKESQNRSAGILNRILESYRDTLDYKTHRDYYDDIINSNFQDPQDKNAYRKRLIERYKVFTDPVAKEALRESVAQYLKVYGIKIDLENDAIEDYIEKSNNSTENFDRDSFEFGGFGNLNSQVRQFIGTCTYTLPYDEFLNPTFRDGTPITQSVNVGKVYNGLLRALSNQPAQTQALSNLISFLDDPDINPETTHFVSYLFTKSGFDYTLFKETGEIVTKDADLLNQVLKGFNQQSLNYLFTGFNKSMEFITSYANTKDSAFYQVQRWNEHFSSILEQGIGEENIAPLKALKDLLNVNKQTDPYIRDRAKRISRDMKRLIGISLSPDFIYYSALRTKPEENLTVNQQVYLDNHPVPEYIEPSILQSVIDQLSKEDKNIFSRSSDIELEQVERGEKAFVGTFLNRWATGNAFFDENVNSMNYRDANGKDRYSYIQKNSIGQKVLAMNNPDWISSVNEEFLQDIVGNTLLSDKRYQKMVQQRRLKLLVADGSRQTDDSEAAGVTWGGMNTRETISYLLAPYNIDKQPDTEVFKGRFHDFYMVPVALRINAEKKSLYSVRLPVIESSRMTRGGVALSKIALDRLYDIVQREADRIRRVHIQIQEGGNIGHNAIEGYNTGSDPRGLHLYNSRLWFSDELRKDIENRAAKGGPIADIKEQVTESINTHFVSQVQAFADTMVKGGLIERTEEGYENILAPEYLFNGYGEYDLGEFKENSRMTKGMFIYNGQFLQNLTQVMMNHFINATEFNNLLHGDEAKLFKNATDPTKRESSFVGTKESIETITIDKDLGIEHPITQIHGLCLKDTEVPMTFTPGKNQKNDDGMMWMTMKGLRYTLFGTCKLDKNKSDIMDRLLSGKLVSQKEFFGEGGLKSSGPFNSIKLLFSDGQVTLKCSAITLTPEYTSVYNRVTGEWDIPISYRKEVHDLRRKMEAYENRNNTIVYAYPTSVSKTLTRNVVDGVNRIDDSSFESLDPQFMGQQLENPSNKVEGTEKSQPDVLITAGHTDHKLPVYIGGEKSTVGDVIQRFNDAKSQKLTNDWENAMNALYSSKDGKRLKIGDPIDISKVEVNIGKFLDHIRQNLEMEGTDAQLLGFLETKDGEPVYNINYPGILPKVTANFFTYFSKGVLQGKVPELSLALVSGARGMGSKMKRVTSLWTKRDITRYQKQGHTKITEALIGQPKTWDVITDSEYRRDPSLYEGAKVWNDPVSRTYRGLKVGDYYVDDLRHNIPEFDEKGNIIHYVSEYLRPAHFKEEMKGVQPALQYSFGVRIPADDKHSLINLKLVDTMPVQLGSVGIFPQELIEIAGPDFDIDKQYVHIADTYVHNGQRIAYGTAKTPEGQFSEFIEWQYENNREFKRLLEGEDLLFTEELTMELLGQDSYRMRIEAALRAMKLPATVFEFMSQGGSKLNNGVQNNIMLQSKMILLGNSNAVMQQDRPTTTQPIKDIIERFSKEFTGTSSDYERQVHDQLTEKAPDINSIAGMVVDRKANKIGSDAIGAIANVNMVYSFLNENAVSGVEKAIELDGISYDTFTHTRSGDRDISLAISSFINGHTDNPKDRDMSKLGLNTKATGFAGYLIAQGMSEENAFLFMLQPSLTSYLDKVAHIDGELRTPEEKRMFKSAQLKALIRQLKDSGVEPADLTHKKLVENIKNGGEDKNIELSVLLSVQKMEQQGNTYMKVANVLKLTQGLPATIEEFNNLVDTLHDLGIIVEKNGNIRKMTDKEWEQLSDSEQAPVIDVRDALMNRKNFISTYLKTVGQLDTLLPAVFLEKTHLFRTIMDSILANFRPVPRGPEGEKILRRMKYDLIGYLGIRAYKEWLTKEKDKGNMSAASTLNDLTNTLIYEQEGDYRNAVQVTADMKDQLSEAGIRSAFLDFLYPNQDYQKTAGLNRLDTNTWTTLSEQQQAVLIESFVDLYANNYRTESGDVIDTHRGAQTLFNYLLVKDGGQFVSGTFIKFLPPFIFKDLMDRIGEVTDRLSGLSTEFGIFGEGVSQLSLLQDFLRGYTTHAANEFYIRSVWDKKEFRYPSEGSPQLEEFMKNLDKLLPAQQEELESYSGFSEVIQQTGDELRVNMLAGIRTTASREKFSALEHMKKDLNWFYLNNLGFSFAEGKSVEFPYAITFGRDRELYTLTSIQRKERGTVETGQLLREGEFAPTGIIATYTRTPLRGSRQQFGAGFVFDDLPLTQDLQGARKRVQRATPATEEVPAGTFESMYTIVRVQNGVKLYRKEGNGTATFIGDYPNAQLAKDSVLPSVSGEPVVSLQTMQEPRRYTPENVTSLLPNQIFVFGSNAEGVHGKGAALLAKQRFGAIQKQAEGIQGQSYAVITKKDWRVEKSSTLPEIGKGLQNMLLYARAHSEKEFLVTKLGSSLAGYTIQEIKALFEQLKGIIPDNVILPIEYEVRDTQVQQISPAQWKEQLSAIYKEKSIAKSEREWTQEALNFRNSIRGTMNDNDIIQKIKECI